MSKFKFFFNFGFLSQYTFFKKLKSITKVQKFNEISLFILSNIYFSSLNEVSVPTEVCAQPKHIIRYDKIRSVAIKLLESGIGAKANTTLYSIFVLNKSLLIDVSIMSE